MGSMLKIVGGAIQGMSEAKAAKERRELVRDMQIRGMDLEFQKMLVGEADKDTGMFTRATRRLIAFMGMLNFAIISILCTLYPNTTLITFTPPENKEAVSILWGLVKFPSGADITTTITTGHISLVAITTLGAIIGFYFTPGGRKG
ncbi:MAG: hypothetical protein ACO3HJ_00070 [Methylophilaceae bacterium]